MLKFIVGFWACIMDEKENFTEFENIHLRYRRGLIPWWVWTIMFMLLGYYTLCTIINIPNYFQNNPIYNAPLGISHVLPFPWGNIVSLLFVLAFWFSVILLFTEKKRAVVVGNRFAVLGLLLCLYVFIMNYSLTGHIIGSIRIETIFYMDLFVRTKDLRYIWQNKATAHPRK
nr:hypothetical protein [uncultured Flavobacterium sp.]